MRTTESAKPLLLLGFSLIIILVIASIIMNTHQLDQFRQQFESVAADHNVRISVSSTMQNSSRTRTILLHKMMVEPDPFLRDEVFIEFQRVGEEFLLAREALTHMDLSEEESSLLERQGKLSQSAGRLQNEIITLLNAGDKDAALKLLMEQAIPTQDKALMLLNDFVQLQERHNEHLLTSARRHFASTQWLIYVLGISLTILCIVITGYIYLRITSIIGMLTQSQDMLRSINIELEESERRERAIRENILEAIITIDQQGRITSCNQTVETMFGYRHEELIGQNISMLTPEPVKSQHDMYLQRYLQTGKTYIIGNNREVEAQKKDGTLFPVALGVTEINQSGERNFIGLLRDVTEQRNSEQALLKARDELEQRVAERTRELLETNQLLRDEISEHKRTQSKLAHLANHDPLTGLPNRTLFNEHLKLILTKADRHREQAALLYIDLDGFKLINDQHGHSEGDRLLQEVAERLSGTVRQEDLVSRIGGDEFTVIIGHSNNIHDEAATVAEKVLHALQRPFLFSAQECHIGASVGISLYHVDANNADEMKRHADHAMYSVKRAKKGTYCFYSDCPEAKKMREEIM